MNYDENQQIYSLYIKIKSKYNQKILVYKTSLTLLAFRNEMEQVFYLKLNRSFLLELTHMESQTHALHLGPGSYDDAGRE